ncbi:PREDICTED: maturin [Miniopterus natalensis]|uniref:maturin n=1 Tax=Miniopterus natalensis TaxID=291302 RepID=UPI0007A70F1E|nr:PREDICTED: maturin [Miniopterus natalensis]
MSVSLSAVDEKASNVSTVASCRIRENASLAAYFQTVANGDQQLAPLLGARDARGRWAGAVTSPGSPASAQCDDCVSFLLPCPGHQHVWSESEDCLPFLQLAQDYISSCGKKTLQEVLEKVFKSFRPLLGLPDADDDAFEEYSADVEEEEPEADHPQMGVSQQ